MRQKGTVLVVGYGSIGRRHVRNLRRLGARDIAVLESDSLRAKAAVQEYGCRIVPSLASAEALKPWAALVCTPPSLHSPFARALLAAGVPCFIEKPLAPSWKESAELARTAARSGTPAVVGYQLRQSAALRWIKRRIDARTYGRLLYMRAEVGQYLPDWRPQQDYRRSYTARRALGGGILLDASHEIDLARWLGGEVKSVSCTARKLSALRLDVEDTAELTLELASGALASVHLDMIQRAYRRTAQFVFERGTVHWEYPSLVRLYTSASKTWKERAFRASGDTFYVDELRRFLDAASSARFGDGLVSTKDAARTLRVVDAARRSSRTGRTVRLP